MKAIQLIILFIASVLAVTYIEIENIRWMFSDPIIWRYFKLLLAILAVISIAILMLRNGVLKTITGLAFWLIFVFIGVLVYHSKDDLTQVIEKYVHSNVIVNEYLLVDNHTYDKIDFYS